MVGKVAGRFFYTALNSETSGAPTRFILEVGALDCMFVFGALEELCNPDNWQVDPDIDLGSMTDEEKRLAISEFFTELIEAMENSRVLI